MTLESTAHQLAKSHTISRQPKHKISLVEDLHEQEELLDQSYQHFAKASETRAAISYAGEWLLDNYYVVQQAIRQIREDMPQGYYDQLPKLSSSVMAGYPRIYALTWEVIGHSQYHVNINQFTRFVQAYQQVSPLTMGELWALPTMLRIGIVKSLTQMIAQATGIKVVIHQILER